PLLAVSTDRAISRTVSFLNKQFPQPCDFNIRLWDVGKLPGSSSAPFTLVLNHPGALRKIFTLPLERSLAEAFLNKDFDIQGDIFSALTWLNSTTANAFSPALAASLLRDFLSLPRESARQLSGRGPLQVKGVRHSRQRDRAAIQYHYDVGNEFYSLWLDKNMQYSCAYFADRGDSLDLAQERKMEHICRKLRLQPGERLLDIGCGWGGLARYAARKYGVSASGVTLSEQQAQYARQMSQEEALGQQVEFLLLDYRDLESAAFDKAVSVGMFEHVGRDHLPEYFIQVFRLLRPGGLFLNHGISKNPEPGDLTDRCFSFQTLIDRYFLGSGTFVQNYVFPDGELVPVSEANLVAERNGFEVRDVENLREHYALTLRHWVDRLEQHRDEAVRVSDEKTYRTWRLFMSASAVGFESGSISVNQSLLSKPDGGQSHLPLTREDLYGSHPTRL
ncbi:MAG: class I SAM-dependent methyltransferase, partial [Anaerolineales bacterium]